MRKVFQENMEARSAFWSIKPSDLLPSGQDQRRRDIAKKEATEKEALYLQSNGPGNQPTLKLAESDSPYPPNSQGKPDVDEFRLALFRATGLWRPLQG